MLVPAVERQRHPVTCVSCICSSGCAHPTGPSPAALLADAATGSHIWSCLAHAASRCQEGQCCRGCRRTVAIKAHTWGCHGIQLGVIHHHKLPVQVLHGRARLSRPSARGVLRHRTSAVKILYHISAALAQRGRAWVVPDGHSVGDPRLSPLPRSTLHRPQPRQPEGSGACCKA